MEKYAQIIEADDWKSFEQSLEQLGKTEKGRAFEELTRLYLLNEPTFSSKITNIWHHSEAPQSVLDELGLERRDVGVDLVAKVKDGMYWAIQCKFHQDRSKNVSYKEVSTLFSITEREKTFNKLSHRLICTSANGVSHIVHEKHPEKLGYLTSADFSKLNRDDFGSFRQLLNGRYSKPVPYEPRPHQHAAVEKSYAFFENSANTRGKIIHPCGSGKSLTGYWVSKKLNANSILIAVPSLALVRQTLGAWTREAVADGIDMDWIAVCSDEDVARSDDPMMQTVDLGIEVDTDPQVIANFLSRHPEGIKILITTYQSGSAVSEGVKRSGKTFDLAIYDEAHKTVGQKDKSFAHLLYDTNVEVKNRVFMTATERQFRGNSDEYLSMDDRKIYGPVIDELTFKAALEQKDPILSDYKIVTMIIAKSEIEQLVARNNFVKSDGSNYSVEGDASTLASMIAVRKLVEERSLKHVVSFHSSIKRAKEFRALNADATSAIVSFGDISTFHVSGQDSTGVRTAEIERFINIEPSLITNARCLTEGVDVPAIDAVLFADPKQSKIDIVQASGRALRRFEGKEFGYIIVPVVFDEGAERPSDDAFQQIIAVISALGMSDERIIEEFKEIAHGDVGARERIIAFDVPEIIRVKFEDFISNIETQIWDRLSFGWLQGYEKLKKYTAINQTSVVPRAYKDDDGFNLGTWVGERRAAYKAQKLSQDKIQKLESIQGWVWDAVESEFQKGFEKLSEYVKEYRTARVKSGYKDREGFNLSNWVGNRRMEYKRGVLASDIIDRLESFEGWVWDTYEANFNEGFKRLEKYVDSYSTSRVPPSYRDQDGFNLGSWVNTRRNNFSKGILSSEQIQRLESLDGWVWNTYEADFDEGIQQLDRFVKENGTAKVSPKYKSEDGYALGSWVKTQRQKYKLGKLSAREIKRFESMTGWAWNYINDNFEQGLRKLKEYVEESRGAQPLKDYVSEDGFTLGLWVSRQRGNFKKGMLPPEHSKKLEAVDGWCWNLNEARFQDGFRRLKKYVDSYSTSRVPLSYRDQDGFNLGMWVMSRRKDLKIGRLSKDKVRQLESLEGWVWDDVKSKD